MGERTRILRHGQGEVMGPTESCTERFMIDGADSGGRFALVEHTVAPGALAAPMHRHTREDEFSFVLAGTFAAILDGEEIEARPGDLVFKPRNQWHTFWNPGEEPTRVLELISPAGLEEFFRLIDSPDVESVADRIAELAESIGCEVDEAASVELANRHGLRF